MSDTLLPYYNRELDALRRLAAEFADLNPKIAGRLRLSKDSVDDPHVARLLEGVAFLAARVHHRIDDEFPELTDALLAVLYPHYLAPMPSVAIAQFAPSPSLTGAARMPSGLTIDTETVRGEPCRFRTAYPLELWPIAIDTVRLSGLPLPAPVNPLAAQAVSCLRISLRCLELDKTFSLLGVDKLRFFLRGAGAASLMELLMAHAVSVAVADGPDDPKPVILPANVLEQVGFAPEEALLPFPARSFSGFRLLTEYFAAPDKFLFLDVKRLDAKTLLAAGNTLDIFVYFDRALPDLERSLTVDSLALGCSPIVNLFPQRCEPIPLDHTLTEYRIVPDARRVQGTEIWSVDRVVETRPGGSMRPWVPFHRLTEGGGSGEQEEPPGFYGIVRRQASRRGTGTDVYLAPHDPSFDPARSSDAVLSISALCLNRDLPAVATLWRGASLPDTLRGCGRGHRRDLSHRAKRHTAHAIAGERVLASRLPSLAWPFERGGRGGRGGALREVLRLYDGRESAETRAAIRALLEVRSAPGTARVAGARPGAFCRGLDVTLTFEAGAWATGGLFLLASVLDRFLALHATVNSFVRTQVVLRERPGVAASWPARAGARVLL